MESSGKTNRQSSGRGALGFFLLKHPDDGSRLSGMTNGEVNKTIGKIKENNKKKQPRNHNLGRP